MQSAFRVGESHRVEPSLNSVTGPAGTVRLEPKVMQVLVCLAAHAGDVVAKEHADSDGLARHVRHRRRADAIHFGTAPSLW